MIDAVQRTFAPGKALLVEDNDINQMVLTESLNRYGTTDIKTCKTLTEARDMLSGTQSDDIALMIFDIMLPDGESHELIREQRALHPSCIIGVYTARTSEAEIAQYQGLGADFILRKPLILEDMFSQFDRCFNPKAA